MIAKCSFAVALAAMLLPSATYAADYHEGIYEPPVRAVCPPPGTPKIYHQRNTERDEQDDRPLLYVAPYQRGYAPVQIYVEPRTAFIVSDACPNQYRQNWYEGKLWYYNAGSPQGPDTFRIIRRD